MHFPRWRYHRDGRSALVRTPEQHEAETPSPEWHDHPVAHFSDEEWAEMTGEPLAQSIEEQEADSADAPAVDERPKRTLICKACGEPGHHAGHCPNRKRA